MILKHPNNDTCISDVPIDGWVEITPEELDSIRSSRTVATTQGDAIRQEISVLLSQAKLTFGQEWLLDVAMASMVSAGSTMGLTEPQLYIANPGYKQVKDLAALVSEKKAQL